jgi:hypothetical protein
VVRRAAGDDHDAAEVAQLLLRHPEPVEHEVSVANTVANRLCDALGLLEDLLEHERLVARTLGRLVVPVDLDDVYLERLAGRGAHVGDSLGLDRGDVAVVRELHAAGLREECSEVRRDEVLALADPDHHRRLMTHSDQVARMVVMDHNECEVALEPAVRGAHSCDEIAAVRLLEQVRDHLGVRLGAECVPGGEQLLA